MSTLYGVVAEIERYAIHDGPGIRTLVFLKGCPLKCLWCCNPESQSAFPTLMVHQNKCFGCLCCEKVCPNGAAKVTAKGPSTDRTLCENCGLCAKACLSEARVMSGKVMAVDDVLEEVMRDIPFYRQSGGGVTFSGGEPTMQIDFLERLLTRCKGEELHTAIETCGYAPFSYYERILPLLNLVLYDLKQMDTAKHREYTGVGNERILENARRIAESGVPLRIRVPLIPSFNDSASNLMECADFVSSLPHVEGVDLLPYHRLGAEKYAALERPYQLGYLNTPTHEQEYAWVEPFRAQGLDVSIGG